MLRSTQHQRIWWTLLYTCVSNKDADQAANLATVWSAILLFNAKKSIKSAYSNSGLVLCNSTGLVGWCELKGNTKDWSFYNKAHINLVSIRTYYKHFLSSFRSGEREREKWEMREIRLDVWPGPTTCFFVHTRAVQTIVHQTTCFEYMYKNNNKKCMYVYLNSWFCTIFQDEAAIKSSLIRVHTFCFHDKINVEFKSIYAVDTISRHHFQDKKQDMAYQCITDLLKSYN